MTDAARIWPVFILLLFSLPVKAGTEMYFVHSDHLGTPRMMTDKHQQVVWKGQSKPFGETMVGVETVTLNRRFPGQWFDVESRRHYNYFRDYDSGLGRYIQSDPIGLVAGLSTYGYAFQNPVLYVDPYGLWGKGSGQMGRRLPRQGGKGSIGFGGQIGTTTVGPSGWGQSGSVGVAAYLEVCEAKRVCGENEGPPFFSAPDSVSGTWYIGGMVVRTDGSICIMYGPNFTWPPITFNWDI